MLGKKKILMPLLLGIVISTVINSSVTASGSSVEGLEYEASHLVVLKPGADIESVAKTYDVDVTFSYSQIFNGFAGVVPE